MPAKDAAICQIFDLPVIPANFKAVNSTTNPYTRIVLSWTKSDNNTGYTIERTLNTDYTNFSDLVTLDGTISKYKPVSEQTDGESISTINEWYSTKDILSPQVLSLKLYDDLLPLLTDDVTVLLSMGIEFGTVGFGGMIEPVKRAGCGKILLSR